MLQTPVGRIQPEELVDGWRLSAGRWEPEARGDCFSGGGGRFTLSWRRTDQSLMVAHTTWDPGLDPGTEKGPLWETWGNPAHSSVKRTGAMLISWLCCLYCCCTDANIRGQRNALLYLQLFCKTKILQNKELLNKSLRITERSVWRKVWNWLLFFF